MTKIYLIGYPQFVSLGRLWCSDNSSALNRQERIMIRDSVTRLNNILKKVARDTDVYYVDIENSLEGGQICDGSSYMTGPIGAIITKNVTYDANMYHPNHRGHIKIAEAIYRETAGNMDYQILDIPLEDNGRRVVRMAVLPDYAGVGSTHTIMMDASMFGPDGEVYIEMFSQHASLGTAKIGADGFLRTTITIPSTIGVGTHLLTISGVDVNDEPVSVQQFITVTSGIEGDADGDGISDQEDACFAIKEWYENGTNVCEPSKQVDIASLDGQNGELQSGRLAIVAGHESAADKEASQSADYLAEEFEYSHRQGDKSWVDSFALGSSKALFNQWRALGLISIMAIGVGLYYAKRKKDQIK